MKNGEEPAYGGKVKMMQRDSVLRVDYEQDVEVYGITKREAFAMAAMQGIMASNECGVAHHPETAASWAVSVADALLEELSKPKTTEK
jgi:hypothetical protein